MAKAKIFCLVSTELNRGLLYWKSPVICEIPETVPQLKFVQGKKNKDTNP